MEMDTTDLIARAGDHNAFRDLVQGHSHELQVHCYRILGSLPDAEDALQETLVSAWRHLGEFGLLHHQRHDALRTTPDPPRNRLTDAQATPTLRPAPATSRPR